MPRLTFPFLPDGLLVPAALNLAATELRALLAVGAALPASIHARGMLDSGTTVTAVAPWILTRLNATPGQTRQTSTPTGKMQVRMYKISFSIYSQTTGTVNLSRGDWEVADLPENPDGVDVLFGLDLLRQIILTVNGPGQTFSLDF
jgi:hypothetical protein